MAARRGHPRAHAGAAGRQGAAGGHDRGARQAAEKFIRSQGATPAFKGYRGFPGSICASPNSMVVHGIPGPYELARGDVMSVDVGVVYDGWVADAARTFAVGPVTPVAREAARGHRGVAVRRRRAVPARQPPRRRLATPCRSASRAPGSSIVRSLVGHGIGRDMHEDPQIPNFGEPGRARCSRRAWCSRSSRWSPPAATRSAWATTAGRSTPQDGSLAAHFEFTVAVTAEGPRILTPWHESKARVAAA